MNSERGRAEWAMPTGLWIPCAVTARTDEITPQPASNPGSFAAVVRNRGFVSLGGRSASTQLTFPATFLGSRLRITPRAPGARASLVPMPNPPRAARGGKSSRAREKRNPDCRAVFDEACRVRPDFSPRRRQVRHYGGGPDRVDVPNPTAWSRGNGLALRTLPCRRKLSVQGSRSSVLSGRHPVLS